MAAFRHAGVKEPMTRVRNYHSTALLMPNGAVWHSGSNRDCVPGPEGKDRTVEIYEPWYFCGPRPVIAGVTSRVCAGEKINIETPNPKQIDEVVMVRCGSFTHAFNPDQRLVSVPFERSPKTGNLLIATLPNNSAVLVPGYYLLFILTVDHVPSEGRFVQVCRSKSLSMRRIEPDQWQHMQVMLEQLRANSEQLSRAKADGDAVRVEENTRKLAELEVAVRRIETLLKMGPSITPIPSVTPSAGNDSGHNHGGHAGGHAGGNNH